MAEIKVDLDEGLYKLKSLFYRIGSLVVVVAGGSCSGKSFLLENLQVDLSLALAIVELDNFFRDYDDPLLPCDEKGALIFDAPESYLKNQFKDCVGRLYSGLDTWSPEYSIRRNKRISAQGKLIKAQPKTYADGLYAIEFLDNLPALMYKVYVEASEDTRLARRIYRDKLEFDATEQQIENFFYRKVKPYHDRCIEPQRQKADLIIVNNS